MTTALQSAQLRKALRFRAAILATSTGMLFSAPFAFFPKHEAIAIAAFLLTSFGLGLAGSLRRVTKTIAITHGLAIFAAIALFFFHGGDLLYIKFMLSIVVSFQFCIAELRALERIRDNIIYYGSRGAILAILSFAVYFAFDFQPFYRTLLADERSLPFFGLTNINFGFNNPEILLFGRPAFLFDEPGQFAHFIILLLAVIATAAPRVVRWHRETRLLVFSGFATFSLAFFVIAAIYLSTKLLRPKTWLVIGAIGVGIYLLSDNPLFDYVEYRLGSHEETDTDGRLLHGDNRSREVTLALEAFSQNIFMGAGWSEADRTIGHFAASIVGPLGYSGLMALLLYLPLLERLYRCFVESRNFYTLLVVGLVGLFFSQRPYFYFPIFIFLLEMMRRQIMSSPKKSLRIRRSMQRRRRKSVQAAPNHQPKINPRAQG